MSDLEKRSGERFDRRRNFKKSLSNMSSLNIDVMRCLTDDNLSNSKTIGLKLSVHQSSISHVLRGLIEDGLVVKTIKKYQLTNIGQIYINFINYLGTAFELLEQDKEFFLTHDMTDVPDIYQMGIGFIYSQREYQDNDTPTPYDKQEYLDEHLSKCSEIRCIRSAVTTDYVNSIANAIKNDANVELILSDKVQQTLRDNYTHIWKEISKYDNLKIYRIREVNFNLCVTESVLFLGLRRLDGSYDLENIIVCKSDTGLMWGNTLFCHYKNKAEFAK